MTLRHGGTNVTHVKKGLSALLSAVALLTAFAGGALAAAPEVVTFDYSVAPSYPGAFLPVHVTADGGLAPLPMTGLECAASVESEDHFSLTCGGEPPTASSPSMARPTFDLVCGSGADMACPQVIQPVIANSTVGIPIVGDRCTISHDEPGQIAINCYNEPEP